MVARNMEDARVADAPEPIQVLTTGGTIDKVYFDAQSSYEVGGSMMRELVRQAHVACPVDIVELMRKDSLELTDTDRALIRDTVSGCASRRIVITHGTDTMDQTARYLGDAGGRTVVLTGSFAPARFAFTDAIFNVGLAFGAVQSLGPGVYIAMNGQVFPGAAVRKNREALRFELVDGAPASASTS